MTSLPWVHHQCNVQLITITTCASRMFLPVERRETPTSARSGPASVLVSTGCSNNMQLQPPPPPCTDHADMTNTERCSNQCNVRERFVGWMVGPHASCTSWLLHRVVLVIFTWLLMLAPTFPSEIPMYLATEAAYSSLHLSLLIQCGN